MQYEKLERLAQKKQWSDLEQEWLTVIERPRLDPARLLGVIDSVVSAGATELASTMGWAWLTTMQQNRPAQEALQLGRGLLLRLPDGNELRQEILSLYRETHSDEPTLEEWIERSGLKSGKSVRLALRYLETGLRLAEGVCLVHRAEDEAAEIIEFDADEDLVVLRTGRGRRTLEVAQVIDEYKLAGENDFRVLSQLRQDQLAELIEKDPIELATGIARCHGNEIDRDELKLLLVPRYLAAGKWSGWWTRVRNGVKRSRNLRIEGRSPMFLVYDEVGQSLEKEVWTAFSRATTPREWLDLLEGYLRDVKQAKQTPDATFLDEVQSALVEHIERFGRHKEPTSAFATALVIERVAADGFPVSTDARGMALEMLSESEDPVAVVASLPDVRLWSLAIDCVKQAFEERWPELFAELILFAPLAHCERLAKRVEKAGRGELLPSVVERAVADPGQFTDAMMWVWKGPSVETPLPVPPRMEMLNILLGLVGPARMSEGKNVGQTAGEMRARIRAGFSSKRYERFKECLDGLDDAMAQTVRRLVERADGLGPRVQEDMGSILHRRFPKLYVKPKVAMWEDESVQYFTRAGLDLKESELDELVNVKMRENAKAIGEAAAHGDLSENAEYKFALEERDLLRARVAQLNREISMAKVLSRHDVPDDLVGIGQRIRLRPVAGGEPVVISVMGTGDTDLQEKVYSYQTPLAGELLGKRVGDSAKITLDDQETEFQIEHIECAIS
jgi:transcription elongation GreA/GreB family factor